jgi:hypothetical protein
MKELTQHRHGIFGTAPYVSPQDVSSLEDSPTAYLKGTLENRPFRSRKNTL